MSFVICSFTGVYEQQNIQEGAKLLDLKDLNGCGMYVDEHAEAVLSDLIKPYAPEGLHFLDNGNYHYMTRIFSSFMKESFDLLVFDHHTDDQKPAMEGLKSCGSWIMDIREENSFLKQTFLIQKTEDYRAFVPSGRPLYVSVDKDVLSEDVLKTNWDQGSMTEEEFFRILDELLKRKELVGLDICGEDGPYGDTARNEAFNQKVIRRWFQRFREQ